MTSFWRAAGLTYIRYSSACARAVRESLKQEYKTDAKKRSEESIIKSIRYENGKPVGSTKPNA